MALNLCFYFQVHQPWRLRDYRYSDVGQRHDYFDIALNRQIVQRVADKCYRPMNALLLELVERHAPHFRVSFSVSATVLEQLQRWAPDVLASFRQLLATGAVELLSETSHHTLAGLYSPREFVEEIALHGRTCRRLLGVPGRVFRNTELITTDAIARQVAALGYDGLCVEGAERVLHEAETLQPQGFDAAPQLAALARHYRLSDDIAFRFSNRQWSQWPLTAERYVEWLEALAATNDARHVERFVGLFMDYETFGEHQWADCGIFEFMRALPAAVLKRPDLRFATPREVLARVPRGVVQLRLATPLSWADAERDTSAWTGNAIQRAAQQAIYALEPDVRRTADAALLEDWRRLLTSDHAYYMSTKYWTDGDVHKYFSHYDSPYDAYIAYMNVLEDLKRRCRPAGDATAAATPAPMRPALA
ncbi:MAG TPA: glycoside hydrolase family 57 protein [Nevskiaceae bacterium]|nr:glycoside hydrolase family 57 protein [Nevskiaceae bacterium]